MEAGEAVMRLAASDMGRDERSSIQTQMEEVKSINKLEEPGYSPSKYHNLDEWDSESDEEDRGWIWINQISINQEHLVEKSTPVAGINKVFQCVSLLMARLGDG